MNRETNSVQKSNLNEDQGSNIPVRRFFARWLDSLVYSTIWLFFLTVVMKINVLSIRRWMAIGVLSISKWMTIIDIVVGIVFVLLIEPVLLSAFGTTIGKWILGIRITDLNGRRLSYAKARSRVVIMLWRGNGFYIPIYNVVRLWKSFSDCRDGKTLGWEYDSVIHLKDQRKWRIGVYIGACITMLGVIVFGISITGMPKHRGDITVAQFCENYNQLSDYYEMYTGYLDEKGQWITSDNDSGIIEERRTITGGVIIYMMEFNAPEFVFSENDGIMTKLEMSIDSSEEATSVCQSRFILAILSFVKAQQQYSLFSFRLNHIIGQIEREPFQNFEFTEYGVIIRGEKQDNSFHFSIEKQSY